jgi:transcriptional regulator with XRE-family HTH domain
VLETYRRIGRRLRWARELMYESQREFAWAMRVDSSTIAKIENGERSFGVINLMNAAQKLRTSADFLLTGDLRLVDKILLLKLVHLHPELLAEHEAAFGPLHPTSAIPTDTNHSFPRPLRDRGKAPQAPVRDTASAADTLPGREKK